MEREPRARDRLALLVARRLGLGLAVAASLAGAPPLLAQTLDDARALHVAGDYRAALEAYAAVVAGAAGSDAATAATAHNNACVIHNGFGEYQEAREQCRRALELRRRLADPRRLARTLNNLAIAQQNLGAYEAARESFLEALEINTRRGDALARVLNLSNLGALATLEGRYAAALDFHRRAAELAAGHADEDWSAEQLQVATINRGVVLEHLGAYREALELYRGLVEAPPEGMSERRRAQLQLNSGVIYRNLGDPLRAVAEFEDVAKLYERLEDPDGLSNALLNLALALDLNLDRHAEAEDAYRRALELSRRHQNRPEEIRDLFHLGRFLAERGRLEEASEVFGRCLEAAEAAGSAQGRWSALAGLGRIAAARGDLSDAAEKLGAAIEEIESAGAGLAEPGLTSGFFGDRRPAYADATQVLADLHEIEPGGGHDDTAFFLAQRAKARALLDALGGDEWTAEPLPASEIAAAVDGPLVEFFVAGRDLLRWKIGSGGLEMSTLGGYEEIRADVLALHLELESQREPDAARVARLSTALLSGLGLGELGRGPLVVASAGVLERLPFELLLVPGGGNELVADRFAVSYVPSASTLVWLRQRDGGAAAPTRATLGLRGFADPRLPLAGADSAGGLLATRFALQPLPDAARSLERLSLLIPGEKELYIGPAAMEAAWRAGASTPARVVHLAAHAVVDERPGRGAAVLLAPGQGHDGLLEPREIAATDQPCELTVLAACRSAVRAGSGGALSSLAGAFLAAGSSAVVATLWDVGDAATAVFMGRFYHHLGRGRKPAEALRAAKRDLRADARWRRPHLWSAYVLIGEASPVAVRRPPLWTWIAGAALLAAGALIARRRRRPRG